jgi:hypothetical protein
MSRVLILSLCLSGVVRAPAGQVSTPVLQPSLDLQGYLAELDRWSAVARELKGHPEQAAALRRALHDHWSINIEHEEFQVSTDWLRQALAALEADHKLWASTSQQIETHLAALRAEAKSLAQPSELSPDAARQKLDEVLSRREFRGIRGPTAFDRLRARLAGWVADLLDAIFGRLRGHPWGTRVFLWLLVLVPGLMFLVWIVRLLLNRPPGPALDLDGAAPAPTTWRDLARQALAAAERGNYRDSVRLAYWAGVYRLEELGVWQANRTRTHREYLRLLPENHPNRAAVSAITLRFEQVWYGGTAASSDDFEFALGQLENLGCLFLSTPAIARS